MIVLCLFCTYKRQQTIFFSISLSCEDHVKPRDAHTSSPSMIIFTHTPVYFSYLAWRGGAWRYYFLFQCKQLRRYCRYLPEAGWELWSWHCVLPARSIPWGKSTTHGLQGKLSEACSIFQAVRGARFPVVLESVYSAGKIWHSNLLSQCTLRIPILK